MTVSLQKTMFYAEPLSNGMWREWYMTGSKIQSVIVPAMGRKAW